MSTITIYNNSSSWRLYGNKLFVVEDIDSYLANFSSSATTINNAQYIKCELEIGINLDLNQEYANDKLASPVYCTIQNSGTGIKKFYYFVKDRIWRSKSCVRLELVMDVLNTFKEGTDYSFKDNTYINREHKDRFVTQQDTTIVYLDGTIDNAEWQPDDNDVAWINLRADGTADAYVRILEISLAGENMKLQILSGSIEFPARCNLYDTDVYEDALVVEFYATSGEYEYLRYRNIDTIPENINPILQCGSTEGTKLEEKAPLNVDWYLLYRNQDDPSESLVNPVECYLIPENELKTNTSYIQDGRLTPSWLTEGKYYWFKVASGQTATLSNGVSVSTRLLITKAGNKINVMEFSWSLVGSPPTIPVAILESQYDDINYIDFTGLPIDYNVYDTLPTIDGSFIVNTDVDEYQFTNTTTSAKIDPISNLDRTDSKNIKLIKLPYCPYSFNTSGGDTLLIAGNTDWEYVAISQYNGGIFHALKLKDMSTKLENSFTTTSIMPFSALQVESFNPSVNDTRQSFLDSKLYNSEFYKPTFVYDSFTFNFQLEKCDIDYYQDNPNYVNFYLPIKFLVTSTINSKFLMKFSSYVIKLGTENYSNVMNIAVNNEEVLYNVPYINYVRTGYNYDIKNKNLNAISTWSGVSASAIGMGVSLVLPSVPLKVAGVISSGLALAVSLINAVITTQKNEATLQNKILQEKNQASSVVGSDDVDLRSEYTENRFKYLVYKPSPVMESLINDLFFYTGYTSNRMGIPTHNNRINFDFLQADISLNNEGSMSQDIIEEIINSFKTGVTYIHKVDSRSGANKWDMNQQLENWEASLFEED